MPTPDESVDPTTVEAEVSDAQLDEKRDEVEELRQELNQIETDRLAREAAKANANVYAQLENEGDRLRALIAAAKGDQPDVGLDAVDTGTQTVEQVTGVGTASTGQEATTDPNTAVPGGAAPDTAAANSPTKAGILTSPSTGEGE